jgi:type I restriction enzyme M protein
VKPSRLFTANIKRTTRSKTMTNQKTYNSLASALKPFFQLDDYRKNSLESTKLLLEGMEVAKVLTNELLPLEELTISKWQELRSKCKDIISTKNPNLTEWVFCESGYFISSLSRLHKVIQEAIDLFTYLRDREVKPVELYRLLVQETRSEMRGLILPSIEFERVMIQSLDPKSGSSIYCPWDASVIFALKLAEQSFSVFLEPISKNIAEIASLLCYVFDMSNIEIKVANPITDPSWRDNDHDLQQFDYTISMPPYGMKYDQNILDDQFNRFDSKAKTGDWMHIAHQMSQTKTRGVIVVPNSFIYKTTGTEKTYKEMLLKTGVLKAIGKLPESHSFTKSQTDGYVLLLEKQNANVQSDLLMFDLSLQNSSSFSKMDLDRIIEDKSSMAKVSLEELVANDFNLSLERYLIQGDHKKVRQVIDSYKDKIGLEMVAKVINPHHFHKKDTGDRLLSICEITLEDIPNNGIVRSASKTVQVADHYFSSANKQELQDGDIIMSVKSKIGTLGLIAKSTNGGESLPWLASQNFVVIRLNKHKLAPLKNEVVLYQYLTSVLIQQYLQNLVQSSSVPMIQIDDIRRLPVLVPSSDEQDRMICEHEKIQSLYYQIATISNEIDAVKASTWANSLFNNSSKFN